MQREGLPVVEFKNSDDVERWLVDKPREVAIVIAARAALRVIPAFANAMPFPNDQGLDIFWIFRAVATAWAAGAFPARAATLHDQADEVLGAMNLLMPAHPSFVTDTAPHAAAAFAAVAARYAVEAVKAVTREARALATQAADTAARAAADAAGNWAGTVSAAATAAASSFAAVSHDADVTNPKVITTALANAVVPDIAIRALWGEQTPLWAEKNWQLLKRGLLAASQDWDVWTDWYEARLRGDPPNEALEIARVLIPDETWDRGPGVVNARIKELIQEHLAATPEPAEKEELTKPPEAPPGGPGPHIVPTDAGFEIVPTFPSAVERNDPTQLSLHAQLNRRVGRLKGVMPRVQNTHKPLYDEFNDYAMFAESDLAALDVPSLWSAGAALNDMVEELSRLGQPNSPLSMTEPLEPDILSQLRSLLRDHMTLMMGFAEGQALAARAAELRLLDIPAPELARRTRAITAPMLQLGSLLAQHARALVQAIDRALDKADEKTFALITAGVATGTHSIVAFGRAVAPFVTASAVGASLTGLNAFDLAGDPNAETVKAALIYIVENADALAAFASHDAQLKVWLDWLISEIRRNIPTAT